MKPYLTIAILLLLFFLGAFVLVEQLQIPLLIDPSDRMATASLGDAFLGVVLLVGDIFLPVPSSLIMVANGALFGVFWGTLLSVLGSLGAAVLGFGIGRRGGKLLERFVSLADRQRADRLLNKWGALAIILTRPLPLLAETTAIMAGTSSMSWKSLLSGALLGNLPAAIVYAITGSLAASFESAALSFGLVLAVAGIFWWASDRWSRANQ